MFFLGVKIKSIYFFQKPKTILVFGSHHISISCSSVSLSETLDDCTIVLWSIVDGQILMVDDALRAILVHRQDTVGTIDGMPTRPWLISRSANTMPVQ